MRSLARGLLVLLSLAVVAGCQSTASRGPATERTLAAPLPGIGSIARAGLEAGFVSFPVAGHELAMKLPDGFCITDRNSPAYLQDALARFEVEALQMKVIALSCATVEGRAAMGFPVPLVIAGLLQKNGAPLVVSGPVGEDFARIVRVLDSRGDSELAVLAREYFLRSVVDRIERGGFTVGHLDMRSLDNRIRLEVLAETPVSGIDGNVWYFADLLVGPVGDRLLGVGVLNIDLVPSPPAITEDSPALFAAVRQVRY